jgi:hypothetical protein
MKLRGLVIAITLLAATWILLRVVAFNLWPSYSFEIKNGETSVLRNHFVLPRWDWVADGMLHSKYPGKIVCEVVGPIWMLEHTLFTRKIEITDPSIGWFVSQLPTDPAIKWRSANCLREYDNVYIHK